MMVAVEVGAPVGALCGEAQQTMPVSPRFSEPPRELLQKKFGRKQEGTNTKQTWISALTIMTATPLFAVGVGVALLYWRIRKGLDFGICSETSREQQCPHTSPREHRQQQEQLFLLTTTALVVGADCDFEVCDQK